MIEWSASTYKVNIQPWIEINEQDTHRSAERLGNRMDQDATFKDKFNLIEAKSWGIHKEVKLKIKTKNLNKNII